LEIGPPGDPINEHVQEIEHSERQVQDAPTGYQPFVKRPRPAYSRRITMICTVIVYKTYIPYTI
jgi:hypothetical protein